MPDTAFELRRNFDDDTLDAMYGCASCEGLEMDMYNLEDNVMRESHGI